MAGAVQTPARFDLSDVEVSVPLNARDALVVGQSLRTLARNQETPEGTRDVYDRVGSQLLAAAIAVKPVRS